jgi:hypothetical protein
MRSQRPYTSLRDNSLLQGSVAYAGFFQRGPKSAAEIEENKLSHIRAKAQDQDTGPNKHGIVERSEEE